MKSESIAFAIAGVVFGLLAGWVIGSQQAITQRVPTAAVSEPAAGQNQQTTTRAPQLDLAQVSALEGLAQKEPANAQPRTQLGNLYFDAERYEEAIKWYSDAVRLDPKNANLSTDLGVSYYYTNQPDKALEQFARSLQTEPGHLKTLLNMGIVKAFGKQDLEGAEAAWQQILQKAPDSPEGQAAKRALDSLKAVHSPGGGKPGA